jgi:mycothiol system anti-sigma-R factor
MSCGEGWSSDCHEVLDRVYEYVDGEMTAEDVAWIREHLATCEECLTEYHLDVALKALVRRCCGCDSAPEDLRQRILDRIIAIRSQFGG